MEKANLGHQLLQIKYNPLGFKSTQLYKEFYKLITTFTNLDPSLIQLCSYMSITSSLLNYIPMNQTKKVQQNKPRPENTNRRPKRCMICRKMFAFEKYNEHAEACSKLQQKRIEESRLQLRKTRNVTVSKNNYQPISMKEGEATINKQKAEQANRFRIKSLAPNNQGKSKSVLVTKKKPQIKQEIRRSQFFQEKPQQQIKIQQQQERQQPLPRQQPVNSYYSLPHEQQPPRNQSNHPIHQVIPQRRESIERQRNNQSQPPQTLIEQTIERVPPRQPEVGYNIQALIDNSNSIIQFIRSVNMIGEDETMNTMLNQLQQLNLIGEQIIHLNLVGHAFGSSMANVFAARIHEMQTVITNQIGIALIRSFNDRLGFEFQGLMQQRPEIRKGFTQSQIEEIFPEKLNWNRKECSICLQDMKPSQLVIQLQCYHMFHPSCIKEWLTSSRKCPMCRKVQQQVK